MESSNRCFLEVQPKLLCIGFVWYVGTQGPIEVQISSPSAVCGVVIYQLLFFDDPVFLLLSV